MKPTLSSEDAKTQTPRTDAQEFETRWDGMGSGPEKVVSADFARTLERENQDLRAENAQLRSDLQELVTGIQAIEVVMKRTHPSE